MQIISDNLDIILPAIIGFIGIIVIICIPFFYQNKKNKEIAKEVKPMRSTEGLSWEITAEEQKERRKKAIVRAFIYGVPIYLISCVSVWLKNGKSGEGMLVFFGIFFVIGFIIAYFVNLHAKYRNRNYFIDSNGLEVSFGEKKSVFKWKDLDYFYRNSDDDAGKFDKNRNDYVTQMKNIRGEKLFLQLKDSREVLVVYSEPENHKKVYEFFKSMLPEKSVSVSGFVKYLYK